MTMPPPAEGEIAHLLAALRDGDRTAFDRLFPLVYQELHAVAHRQLARGRPGETLDTTALLHEVFLKLSGAAAPEWENHRHFFAVAARAMRQIIVDYARHVAADKRGGGASPLPLDASRVAAADRAPELVALDEALTELGTLSPRLAEVVELRFFAGLSVDECAAILDCSPRTIKRDWQKARAFLYRVLGGDLAEDRTP